MNGILHRGDITKAQEKLKTVADIKFRQIFGLLYSINQRIDLFSKYNVTEIFEFRIVSVDNKYRGSGIAKQLLLRSELIAEEYGFKVRISNSISIFQHFILYIATEIFLKISDGNLKFNLHFLLAVNNKSYFQLYCFFFGV